MRNTICAALTAITLVLCAALAGCGNASKTSTPSHATGTTCSEESGADIKECVVTLSDTRKVDCVVYSGYKQGGLSCDWSHVSGADEEPR